MKTSRKHSIRYAVVGLGHLAQVAVLPAFRRASHSELAAVVSSDPQKLETLGRRYHVSRRYSYDEYDQCLADGVDAVYIVLPNHLHREFAVRAFRAGVHVLCEKPMALTERDCRDMISAATKSQRKLMIAYRLHFERMNLQAIETAQRGKLGELRFFSSEFGQQVVKDNVRLAYSIAEGGGPIYDMGIYCINAARYLFRAEPTQVFATAARRKDSRFDKADEMTSVMLRFSGERLATFTASFGCADIDRYTLIGTQGVLTADPAFAYSEALKLTISNGSKSRVRTFAKRDQFAAELTYFSECILTGKDPEPSGEEGLRDVRVIQAIYRSDRTGRAINLPSLTRKHRPDLTQEIRRLLTAKQEQSMLKRHRERRREEIPCADGRLGSVATSTAA